MMLNQLELMFVWFIFFPMKMKFNLQEGISIGFYSLHNYLFFFEKKRINPNGQSEYLINDKVVTYKQYSKTLQKENILVSARNFLVFQVRIFFFIFLFHMHFFFFFFPKKQTNKQTNIQIFRET